VPAVNQIELYPYFQNSDVDACDRAYGNRHGSMANRARARVLDDPALMETAKRLGKVCGTGHPPLAHRAQQPVFPKSVTPERIKENFELFDFELEPGDAEKIDALDTGEACRDGPNPSMFDYAPS
jgi:2,5-diketo-D-gluconate reductase A